MSRTNYVEKYPECLPSRSGRHMGNSMIKRDLVLNNCLEGLFISQILVRVSPWIFSTDTPSTPSSSVSETSYSSLLPTRAKWVLSCLYQVCRLSGTDVSGYPDTYVDTRLTSFRFPLPERIITVGRT